VKQGVRIIFEDRWLIVVDKSSGLLSVAAGGKEETAYRLVTDYVGHKIFIVHRLDRDTSGILVFAKDWETKNLLQENWDSVVLERRYTAMVKACPPEDCGTVTSWLKEHPVSLKMSSCPFDNGGQKAITDYKVIKKGNEYSLVDFTLHTGRKNQIRVHSALLGCPVAGDKRYWDFSDKGVPASERGPVGNPIHRLALHACRLVLIHPHTGRQMKFRSPLPGNFRAI